MAQSTTTRGPRATPVRPPTTSRKRRPTSSSGWPTRPPTSSRTWPTRPRTSPTAWPSRAARPAERVQEVAGNFKGAVDKSVKDQPMATLAVAAVLGFVLGALWKS